MTTLTNPSAESAALAAHLPASPMECACGDLNEIGAVVGVVHNWHNDNHAGPFRFCPEQPCDAVRRESGQVG